MASIFENRISLVTGGSRGVGRAVCSRPRPQGLGRGADLPEPHRPRPRRSRARSRRSAAARCRSGSTLPRRDAVRAAVAQVIGEWGEIDLLVHSAGALAAWSHVRDLPNRRIFARFIDVDLTGAFNVVQAVLVPMHARGRGTIVAISSIAAQMCQARNVQGAAAKAGLEAMIRVVAREEGRHGIRANVVSIGLTDTAQTAQAFERWGPERAARVVAGIPLGRIARPEGDRRHGLVPRQRPRELHHRKGDPGRRRPDHRRLDEPTERKPIHADIRDPPHPGDDRELHRLGRLGRRRRSSITSPNAPGATRTGRCSMTAAGGSPMARCARRSTGWRDGCRPSASAGATW